MGRKAGSRIWGPLWTVGKEFKCHSVFSGKLGRVAIRGVM